MGKAHSDITVVIPAYNREAELRRCLDSIAAQTTLPARVIVVDDGSTDNTADVARRHPVGAEVVDGAHRGAPAARNAGLDRVTTQWTMFFDSDDVMKPDHLAKAAAHAVDGADIVGWDVEITDLHGRRRRHPFETPDIEWHNVMHGTMATLRYMARTELFRRAGGWNPDVLVWDDIELGARMLRLGPRVVKAPGISVSVLSTPVSITGTTWSGNRERYAAVFEALTKTLGPEHSDWLDLKKAILAADMARENAAEGRAFFDAIERKTAGVRLAYLYRRAGLRGAARVLRKFFSK